MPCGAFRRHPKPTALLDMHLINSVDDLRRISTIGFHGSWCCTTCMYPENISPRHIANLTTLEPHRCLTMCRTCGFHPHTT
ncbi:hypothetical protein BDV32DRAFT_110350 [Aspergillus pseudonomiae]|nr:hypothetical protein BDV32DRAFT_110350 [Aspergillus pseudonomiae]